MPQTPERKAQYQRDFRKGLHKGGTSPDKQGTSLDEGQRLHKGAAPGAKILSDGQLWYPGNNGYHPIACRCDAHPDRTTMTDSTYTILCHPLGR